MIAVDTNILIYAHVSSAAQHQIAKDWLNEQLSGTAQVGIEQPSMPQTSSPKLAPVRLSMVARISRCTG